jgi:hypothetical protein|tara:strand:- start:379 stop:771 length:393 start_codon:yes stop_codon:yes gene_type:complete
MYQPSDIQIETRQVARSLYDQGYRLVGEWCRRIPQLTPKLWGAWEREDGFQDWWSELFPEHAGTTISDLRALEFEANRALMMGLADGDLGAAKLVVQMVQNAQLNQHADSTLEEWFSEGSEEDNGWMPEN